MTTEFKLSGGRVAGTAATTATTNRGGVEVGVFRGLLATWDPDTGGKLGIPDRFARGAFAASLREHRARGMRPVRMKLEHGELIGGFPIESVRETARGLEGVGEVNLETELGRRAWALLRQGALTDLSVGFVAIRSKVVDGVRRIERALLLEASLVGEPANQRAVVTEVKRPRAPRRAPALTDGERLTSIVEDLGAVRAGLRRGEPPTREERLHAMMADLRGARSSLRGAAA